MVLKILIMTELCQVSTFHYPEGMCLFFIYKKDKELPLISLLAPYFGVTAHQRSDGLRADIYLMKVFTS